MYVDAILDKNTDTVRIIERVNGKRVPRDIPASYVFYYEDATGSHRSIFGHRCKRIVRRHAQEFYRALRERRDSGRRIFESDIKPVFRALEDHYQGADAPVLHLGYIDIEVAFVKERGFAPPEEPFSPITAITLYLSATQRLQTYALAPASITSEQAGVIGDKFDDTIIFDSEANLLDAFLTAIDDVDCLLGWHSASFDVPYLVNRTRRVVSIAATKRFCLWDQQPSQRRYPNKFRKVVDTYDLHGRVHLDYLDLYAKHTPQQRASYALNAIAEIELGETKVPYDGTLDDLYQKDFEKFIAYNRQDVMLIVKLDRKLRYIELANQTAHANCVLLQTTVGSVALVEQAIILEMHAMGRVVPERKREVRETETPVEDEEEEDDEEEKTVAGAYVAKPKTGIQEYIGCMDIKSLYPSTIRALNMSPETLVAQVRLDETQALVDRRIAEGVSRAEAWDGLFCTLEVQHMHDRDDARLTADFFDHLTGAVTTRSMTGKQLYEHIFNPANQLCITANGTVFSTAVEGMIPALLTKWYAERKLLQEKQSFYAALAAGIEVSDIKSLQYPIGHNDIRAFADENDLVLRNGKLVPRDDHARIRLLETSSHWDRRQASAKVRLNSLYGTLLNEGFRMFDERLGQSTTLTGRTIVRHMNAQINQIITGEYDYTGAGLIYSDTDSSFFSAYRVWKDDSAFTNHVWTAEEVIELYDTIAKEANATFPEFMQRTFNTSMERGSLIRAGRELVASRGLFIKKKKYALLMIDKEGKRLDGDGQPGKLKVMGLDLKRADTPKIMQQFLAQLLMSLLTGVTQGQMFEDIRQFRRVFRTRPGWEKGHPTKATNLSSFAAKLDEANNKATSLSRVRRNESLRVQMPGHITASLNWNRLCDLNNDPYAMRISDSNRIIVCKLHKNALGMTSVAYPIDEPHLPKWFQELPFDNERMEETIIDKKIENLVGVLDWDLSSTKVHSSADNLFSWA